MKLSDVMEIVVIDKNGAHEMKTTKNIDEYLAGDKDESQR